MFACSIISLVYDQNGEFAIEYSRAA